MSTNYEKVKKRLHSAPEIQKVTCDDPNNF